jgi:hypothetical protein
MGQRDGIQEPAHGGGIQGPEQSHFRKVRGKGWGTVLVFRHSRDIQARRRYSGAGTMAKDSRNSSERQRKTGAK